MVKLPGKKWLWLLLLPLAGLLFLSAMFNLPAMIATQIKVQSKDCADPLFTIPPIDFDNLESITPLGNLNPPDHTLPTDHVYISMPAGVDNDNNDRLPPPARKVANVYAPGDIIITDIERVEYFGSDGKLQRADFSVSFAACRSVSGYYHHLSAISAELSDVIGQDESNCDRYATDSAGAKSVKRCKFLVGHNLKAGAVIGQAGAQFSSFDLGLMDDRVPALGFANPKRLGGTVKTVCPFDYYASDIKQKFATYFGFGEKKRLVPPVCGEIMQDKIGTAQGNWFLGDAKDGPEGWSKEMSLVHDNVDPALGAISVGGTVSAPLLLQFAPTHSGTTNREFAEIRPGPELYCYPSLADGRGIKRGQQFLIQLQDDVSIKVEQQTGGCQAALAFTAAAKTYER